MRDQLQPTFSTCIDLSHQNTFYKNNHPTQRSLLTETVFSQLWLTRVFLTSPCHRLQLQLIPNLFRTTVPYPCLHHTHIPAHTHTQTRFHSETTLVLTIPEMHRRLEMHLICTTMTLNVAMYEG